MPHLPRRSTGLLRSGATTATVHDLVTARRHRLNPTAHALLEACDGTTDLDDLVSSWAEATGAAPATVRADVETAVRTFADLGLVGRVAITLTAPALADATADPAIAEALDDPVAVLNAGRVHPVVDHALQFVGPDADLVALLDDHLGPGIDAEPTRRLFVDGGPDGSISVVADSAWTFADRDSLLDQVTSAINEYSHDLPSVAVLHAAGLVAPDGRVVVLPATSGAGKSTLTGHLIAAGWDYLGDEAIGVRPDDLAALPYPKPLALSAASRSVLGLADTGRWVTAPEELRADVGVHATSPGPIDLVVLPTYAEGAAFSIERLAPADALGALLDNVLNLAAGGQPGMDALDGLATSVPVHRARFGDAADLEAWLRRSCPGAAPVT